MSRFGSEPGNDVGFAGRFVCICRRKRFVAIGIEGVQRRIT